MYSSEAWRAITVVLIEALKCYCPLWRHLLWIANLFYSNMTFYLSNFLRSKNTIIDEQQLQLSRESAQLDNSIRKKTSKNSIFMVKCDG